MNNMLMSIKNGLEMYNNSLEKYSKLQQDPIINHIKKIIKNKISVIVEGNSTITESGNYVPDATFVMIIDIIKKLNDKNINNILIPDTINNNYMDNRCNLGNYATLYKNHIILIKSEKSDSKIYQSIELSIQIIGKHSKDILSTLILERNDYGTEPSRTEYHIISDDGYNIKSRIKKESLFIDQLDYIDKYVKRWIENKNKYLSKNIDYTLNILLHGVPGNGKTTIAKYLASEYNGKLYNIDPYDNLYNIQRCINYNAPIVRCDSGFKPTIFLIDDFENSIVNREDDNNMTDDFGDKERKLNFFLSLLDGAGSRNGCIFIFTTNYINKLDPAFKRPGRFNIIKEIKPLIRDKAKQLIDFYLSDIYDNIDYESIFKDIKSEQDENYKYRNEDVYTPAEIKKQCLEILTNKLYS